MLFVSLSSGWNAFLNMYPLRMYTDNCTIILAAIYVFHGMIKWQVYTAVFIPIWCTPPWWVCVTSSSSQCDDKSTSHSFTCSVDWHQGETEAVEEVLVQPAWGHLQATQVDSRECHRWWPVLEWAHQGQVRLDYNKCSHLNTSCLPQTLG